MPGIDRDWVAAFRRERVQALQQLEALVPGEADAHRCADEVRRFAEDLNAMAERLDSRRDGDEAEVTP